jgi:hypothetical protein
LPEDVFVCLGGGVVLPGAAFVRLKDGFVCREDERVRFGAGNCCFLQIVCLFVRICLTFWSPFKEIQMGAGCDSYRFARVIYHTVKTAARQKVPGAKPIYDEMKLRYLHKGKEEDTVPAEDNVSPPEQDNT